MKKKLAKLIYNQLNGLYYQDEPILAEQITSLFKAIKKDLEKEQSSRLKEIVIELETLKALKPKITSEEVELSSNRLDDKIKEFRMSIEKLQEMANENQKIIDDKIITNELHS